MPNSNQQLEWHRVADVDEIPSGRVKTVTASELPVWQTGLHNPSFAAYAKLCGGKGIRITKAENLESALKDALDHQGPALVEIITDADLI